MTHQRFSTTSPRVLHEVGVDTRRWRGYDLVVPLFDKARLSACRGTKFGDAMKCPYCKALDDKVIDSRTASDGSTIRRRRECLACSRRYTTYEKVEEIPFRVIKKDGTRVPFDRTRILNGMLKACEKRPVSAEELDEVVDRIESRINEMFDKEVASKFIGNMVMESLRDLDQVAYVRFASVYREFKDVGEFMEELQSMFGKDAGGKAP